MYKKRIILNKALLVAIIGIPVIVYASYFIIEIVPIWDTLKLSDNYSSEKNYSLRAQALISVLEWNAICLQTGILDLLYPIFILFGLLRFKEDLRTYFILGKTRFNNYYRALIKSMLAYSAVIAICFTLGHMLIYLIFAQFSPLTTDIALESTSYISKELLPIDFFDGHALYYFLTITVVNDLPIIFSYSLLFCVITLFTKNNLYLFILIPFGAAFCAFFLANAFQFQYLALGVPITGYYSRITDIWKYTLYPLVGSLFGFWYYYNWGDHIWKLKRPKL